MVTSQEKSLPIGSLVAGVDGCRAGWLAVRLDPARGLVDWAIHADWIALAAALEGSVARIAVDMPIGLPGSGARGCDIDGRQLLGPRRNTLFPGLRRPLLDYLPADYAGANAWAKSDGAGLSRQAWNLLPKIKQIDDWITPERAARVHECHPELAFRRLNGDRPVLEKKNMPDGERRRRALLRAAGCAVPGAWLRALPRGRAKPDDLIDACVCAWLAGRIAAGEGRALVGTPPTDARGLPMTIWN
jgi:predicted RNase H-like nuclease